jgi:hypothetical protein
MNAGSGRYRKAYPVPQGLHAALRIAFTCKRAGITWPRHGGPATTGRFGDGRVLAGDGAPLEGSWKGTHRGAPVLAPGGRLLASERQVRPGATGLAGHGWMEQQAESFAAQYRTAGLPKVRVGRHGARTVWTLGGVRPRESMSLTTPTASRRHGIGEDLLPARLPGHDPTSNGRRSISTLGRDLIWVMSVSESSFQRFTDAMTGLTDISGLCVASRCATHRCSRRLVQ